jgi:hypothetical protein
MAIWVVCEHLCYQNSIISMKCNNSAAFDSETYDTNYITQNQILWTGNFKVMHDRGIGFTLFCLVMMLAFIPLNTGILKKERINPQKLPCFSMMFHYIILWLVYSVLQVQLGLLAQFFLRPQIHTHKFNSFWHHFWNSYLITSEPTSCPVWQCSS